MKTQEWQKISHFYKHFDTKDSNITKKQQHNPQNVCKNDTLHYNKHFDTDDRKGKTTLYPPKMFVKMLHNSAPLSKWVFKLLHGHVQKSLM